MVVYFSAKESVAIPSIYSQRLVGPWQLISQTRAWWIVRYADSPFLLHFPKQDWHMEHHDGLHLPPQSPLVALLA